MKIHQIGQKKIRKTLFNWLKNPNLFFHVGIFQKPYTSSRFRVYNPSLFIPHMLDLLINIFITSFPNLEECSIISIDYFLTRTIWFSNCVSKNLSGQNKNKSCSYAQNFSVFDNFLSSVLFWYFSPQIWNEHFCM